MSAPDVRRSTLVVGAANLLSRVTGLAREVAFAAALGAGPAADAFNVAFRIGNLLRELFAEGALSNAFVPLFARATERGGEGSGWALANALLGGLTLALGALALLTMALAEPLVLAVAGGFAQTPGKVELTTQLTRILAPFVATISFASVFMGMLNVRGRFFLPALSPAAFNLCVIAACLLAEPVEAATGLAGVKLVAWAALLGGALQALAQLPALRRAGFRLRPNLRGHPELRRLLAFMGPAVVAISVVQIHLLIETWLAAGQGDGPVSWLLYAFRLAHLPFSAISGSVAVAGLAGLAVYAARRDDEGFTRTLAQALNLNVALLLPSAVGLFVLADPLVAAVFERGAFSARDTAETAGLLRAYAVAIVGIGAQRVLVPVFYTLADPRTPMWVGLATVALKAPVALALMGPLGVVGIPASHAVLAGAESVALLALLGRRTRGLGARLFAPHLKALAAAAGMGAVVWAAREGLGADGGLALAGQVALGVASWLGLATLLGMEEARLVLARLRRGPPRGLPPSVDDQTRALLARLAREPHGDLRLEAGGARVPLADLDLHLSARGGALTAEPAPPTGGPLAEGDVRAVMRVGQGPPQVIGLILDGPEGRRSLRVDGEALVEGEAEGPRVNPGEV